MCPSLEQKPHSHRSTKKLASGVLQFETGSAGVSGVALLWPSRLMIQQSESAQQICFRPVEVVSSVLAMNDKLLAHETQKID